MLGLTSSSREERKEEGEEEEESTKGSSSFFVLVDRDLFTLEEGQRSFTGHLSHLGPTGRQTVCPNPTNIPFTCDHFSRGSHACKALRDQRNQRIRNQKRGTSKRQVESKPVSFLRVSEF